MPLEGSQDQPPRSRLSFADVAVLEKVISVIMRCFGLLARAYLSVVSLRSSWAAYLLLSKPASETRLTSPHQQQHAKGSAGCERRKLPLGIPVVKGGRN